MIEFKPGAGIVVAGDVQNAVLAVDAAILNQARLCASFIEATQSSNLPVSQSQKVIKSLTTSMSAVADGREEMVSAVRHLTTIKNQSNLAEENYGCPTPCEPIVGPTGRANVSETA